MTPQQRLVRIRLWIVLFVVCLVLSGVTAFPVLTEVRWVLANIALPSFAESWMRTVLTALEATPTVVFYGFDCGGTTS